MKFIKILLLFVLLFSVSFAAFARHKPGAKVGVEFAELVYDFGNITASAGAVEHIFTLTNTGENPVAILKAMPSCGCTVPSFSHKPLRPGECAEIKVLFNPSGQKGEVEKNIKVKLKSAKGKTEEVTLRIVGVVIPE